MGCAYRQEKLEPTVDLRLQPAKGGAVELLVGGAVGEAVGDGDVGEELEDAALHGQLVEVGVQEGHDALGYCGLCSHGDIGEVLENGGRRVAAAAAVVIIAVGVRAAIADGGVVGQRDSEHRVCFVARGQLRHCEQDGGGYIPAASGIWHLAWHAQWMTACSRRRVLVPAL
jgi:hypothetical protein